MPFFIDVRIMQSGYARIRQSTVETSASSTDRPSAAMYSHENTSPRFASVNAPASSVRP